MKRCPACHRFGVSFDPTAMHERCDWKDCNWLNVDDIDVDKVKHPIKHWKFIKAITKKVSL